MGLTAVSCARLSAGIRSMLAFLDFWNLDFKFFFSFLDLRFLDLDHRFVKIDVRYCP